MSEIQKVEQPQAMVGMRGGGLMAGNMEGVFRLATAAFKSGVLPSAKTTEEAFVIMAAGFEMGLGFTATCKNVMLVNRRPAVWGDALIALARRSSVCKSITETLAGTTAKCVCVRRGPSGEEEVVERTFSEADAKKAGLWGKAGPWTQYPNRMLQLRARTFAIRDAFPDLLMGLGVVEEVEDYAPTVTNEPTESPKALPVALPEVPEESDDGAAFLASLEPVEKK